MHATRFVLVLLAAAALACSSASSPGSPGGGSSSSGGSSSGGGSGGSSGGSGSGGSSGASSSGGSSGGSSSGSTGQEVTLTIGPFTVPAGTEVFKCQNFANPFKGVTTDIAEYEEHMTVGSHHMFVFFAPGATDGPLVDCPAGGLEFHPYPFSAQSKDAVLTYPPGVGSVIPGSNGLELNAHFVNTSQADYQATLTVVMHVAAPGTVTQHAGVIFMNNASIDIPPTLQPSTATATCTLPQDVNIMLTGSHMHQRATNFIATSGSKTLYQTTTWSDPMPTLYSPPLFLPSGSGVTWSCTYINDTNSDLTFGESATTNVMCIFTAHYYPVADTNNPNIVCQQ
jgi:hypothetical protein